MPRRSSGTYRYTECIDCPDGQIEWTRSGSWYHCDAVMYPNDAACPEESGIEDDEPADIVWCPDEGPTRDVADLPPAFLTLALAWIDAYHAAHEPEPDSYDEPYDPRDDYDPCERYERTYER